MMWLTLEPSPTDNLTIKPLILARCDALVRFQCPLLGAKVDIPNARPNVCL
jgi:hypothetical protein